MKILIKNGRVIDPASSTDETLDILIVNNKIADIKPKIEIKEGEIIDASRLVVVPGLIDIHTHLREPGFEHKETIATGARAAARGGFTTVCAMPNTNPVNDNSQVTRDILKEARRSALVNVLPIAALTKSSKGEELTDLADLIQAGAVAFSDDGRPVTNNRLMKKALELSRSLETLIIDHCEDARLSADGVMNEGKASARFKLKGIPSASEEILVARDIVLARATDSRIHLAHLSTAGSVAAVREAKKRGLKVTAEATPHHLTLDEEQLASHDPNFKMNPPLRSKADIKALLEGISDGTIDVIATDHAPHTEEEKSRGIDRAPFGVIGLETAVPVILDRLVHRKIISLKRFVELMSFNPANIIGLKTKGRIQIGLDADLTILNLSKETTIDKNKFESKGRNTPFDGWKLRGTVVVTIVRGMKVYPFPESINKSVKISQTG